MSRSWWKAWPKAESKMRWMGGWKWNPTLFDVKTFKVKVLPKPKKNKSDLPCPCTSFLNKILSLSSFWLCSFYLRPPHSNLPEHPRGEQEVSPGLCWCTFPGRSRTERSTRWSPPSTRTRTGRSATQSLEWVSAACGRKQCIKGSFEQCYLLLTVFTFAITIDIKMIALTEAIQTWKMSNILPR